MKRITFVLAIAMLVVLATAGSALANFGPHGAYSLDTDACAGCHRAHTSFSTLTWTQTDSLDNTTQRSALLISSASTMEEFCYACHGADAPGASTNVVEGVFDSGPSGADGVTGVGVLYETNSAFNATLNGGSFGDSTSSMHDMGKGSVTDPMWGDGTSAPAGTDLTCTSCHDVHGSSNYRLLKDRVNNNTVGGYDGDTPQPFVISFEENYPTGGWLKHEPGADQMELYKPNYTTPEYAWRGTASYSGGQVRSMSTWCSACHEAYNDPTGEYDYNAFESTGIPSRLGSGELTVTAGTELGSRNRHRHRVDTTPGTVTTAEGWGSDAITSTVLPLEKRPGALASERGTWELNDYMGCLTCHFAHGTSAEMTGWANARLVNDNSAVVTWSVEPTTVAPVGVNPNFSSSLLRTDNRGVCERCHNK